MIIENLRVKKIFFIIIYFNHIKILIRYNYINLNYFILLNFVRLKERDAHAFKPTKSINH